MDLNERARERPALNRAVITGLHTRAWWKLDWIIQINQANESARTPRKRERDAESDFIYGN